MKQLFKIKELRSFLILWGSQAVSSFGTAMTNFALIIWAYKQQGTVSSITLLSVCSYLPSILFCFLAGTEFTAAVFECKSNNHYAYESTN